MESYKMYFPAFHCFLFVFTLFPFVRGDACADLENCANQMENGPNGTFSYLKLTSFPEPESAWTKIYQDVCSTKDARKSCAQPTTCNNQTTKNYAEFAAKQADSMCNTDGVNFFRRIYTESSQCIGNTTKVGLAVTNRASCKNQFEYNITDSMDITQKCSLLNQTKFCDMRFHENMCGNLYGWLIDIGWYNRIAVYYPSCHSTLYPGKQN